MKRSAHPGVLLTVLLLATVVIVLPVVAGLCWPITSADQPARPTLEPTMTPMPTLMPSVTAYVSVPTVIASRTPAWKSPTPTPSSTSTPTPAPTATPDILPAQVILPTVTPMLRPPPAPYQAPRRP